MPLLRESPDFEQIQQAANLLRTESEILLDTHGQVIRFGENLPIRLRRSLIYLITHLHKLVPNTDGISLDDRLASKKLLRPLEIDNTLQLELESKYADVKKSPWIATRVVGSDEQLFLYRNSLPRIFQNSQMGVIDSVPKLAELARYGTLIDSLRSV